MTDLDVTLTDYGLALLCAFLAWRAWCVAARALRRWLAGFFLAAGAASLFGGTVHGFFSEESTRGHDIFWPLTMLSLGLTAVAVWGLGASTAVGAPTVDGSRGLLPRASLAMQSWSSPGNSGLTWRSRITSRLRSSCS